MWLFSMFISVIADWMIYSERFNHTSTRKIINSIGKPIGDNSIWKQTRKTFLNAFIFFSSFRSIQPSHLPYYCFIHWLQSCLDRCIADAGRWTQRRHLFRFQNKPFGHYTTFCWHSDGIHKLHSQFGRSVGTDCCWTSDWWQSMWKNEF